MVVVEPPVEPSPVESPVVESPVVESPVVESPVVEVLVVESLPVSSVRLLAPTRPSKVLALWNNFGQLAAKLGLGRPEEPLYLIKSPNSYLGPGMPIRRPPGDDHEDRAAGRVAPPALADEPDARRMQLANGERTDAPGGSAEKTNGDAPPIEVTVFPPFGADMLKTQAMAMGQDAQGRALIDVNPTNNMVDSSVPVVSGPDLALKVTENKDSIDTSIQYTLQVTNLGEGAAQGAKVVYQIPPGATVLKVEPGAGWSCTTAPSEAEQLPQMAFGVALLPAK